MQCVLVLLIVGFIVINAQKDIPNILNFCQSTITLSDHGKNSSISLALSPVPSKTLYTLNNPCRIHISTPNTHLLYIRVVDNKTEQTHLNSDPNKQQKQNIQEDEAMFQKQLEDYISGKPLVQKRAQEDSCPLNVYQPELSDNPSYSIDACEHAFNPEGGLLSHQAELTFTPGSEATDRWLQITAVGAGEVCLNSKQHSCLQAGWTPLLCISKDLLCDGVVNCPTGGVLGDENPQFCKDRKSLTSTNWEKIANDFLKKFSGKVKGQGGLLPAIQKGHNRWQDSLQTTTLPNLLAASPSSNNITETSTSSTLGQYGPWGYLMLGMLICGTVLTFCGLWECCCRRNKAPQAPQGGTATPSGVSITSGGIASTAVLVVTAGPPKYEELDQPPSYSVLFPEKQDV